MALMLHECTRAEWDALTLAERKSVMGQTLGALMEDIDLRESQGLNGLQQYRMLVLAAIRCGHRVPDRVLAQDALFRAAAAAYDDPMARAVIDHAPDGPNRDTSLLDESGVALRRMGGMPVAPELREAVRAAMVGIDAALGTGADIWRRAGLTIILRGSAPFYLLPAAGGVFMSRTMTIALRTYMFDEAPLHALCHELAHLIDCRGRGWAGARMEDIYVSERAVAGVEADLYARALRGMTCGSCAATGCVSPGGRRCGSALGGCACRAHRGGVDCADIQANAPYVRRPAELFARLVEQFHALQTPSAHSAMPPYLCYSALPGYWSDAEFTGLVPLVQEAIDRRVTDWRRRAWPVGQP